MSKTLTLILASAALTAAVGLPTWGAMHLPGPGEAAAPLSALFGPGADSRPLILADSDEHEDEGGSVTRRQSGDDDENECDDDEGEGSCGPSAPAPAPAGSVAPPQNGLFDNGAAPKVQVK